MIAMQYSLTLPADYDMTIVERRIREKGPLMDGFGGLGFKAFLSARISGGTVSSVANLYAPFYLWTRTEGMVDFLTGPGFAALSRDFGRPRVAIWPVWHARWASEWVRARTASREVLPLDPDADLAAVSAMEGAMSERAIAEGAAAALAAFDPKAWQIIRFRLWPDEPRAGSKQTQLYDVGHIARG